MVELVRGGGLRGVGDKPVFKSVCQPWPVGFLAAWSGLVVVGGGGAKSNHDGGVIRSCRGEGLSVPGPKCRKHMWVSEGKVDGAGSIGASKGEASINSQGVKEYEAQV